MSRMLSVGDLEPYAEEPHPLQALPPQSHQDTDLREIEDALSHLDPDMAYETWIRVGMSLRHALGDGGFSLWDAWSSRGGKYTHEKDLRTHWKSFREQRGRVVTIRTLFQMAHQAGWRSSRTQHTPCSSASTSPTPLSLDMPCVQDTEEPVEILQEEDEELTPYEVLKRLTDADPLNPPGIVKSVFKGIEHRARYSQPQISLAASIVFIGFMLRNRVRTENLRTNFYVLAVSASASGKDNAPICMADLASKLDLENYYINDVSSVQGIEGFLGVNQGCALIVQDEAKYLFQAQKDKNSRSVGSKLQKFYLDAYSEKPLYRSAVAKDRIPKLINAPFVALYQSSTESVLEEFSTNDYETGLFRRYLFVRGNDDPEERDPPQSFPLDLIPTMKELLPRYSRNPSEAQFAPEAKELLEELKKELKILRTKHKTHIGVSLIPTLMEHVKKLCLLGAEPPAYMISRNVLAWSISVALESFKGMWALASGGLVDSPREKHLQRLFKVIQKHSKGKFIASRYITRNYGSIEPEYFWKLIKSLEENGLIATQTASRKSVEIRNLK